MKALLSCLLLSVFLTCKQEEPIHILGDIENLPDGEMIFYTRDRKMGTIVPLDSCNLINGHFDLILSDEKYPEPIKVFLNHRELESGILRIFSFKTNLKYQGSPMNLDHFYLENDLKINGKASENTFKVFKPKASTKFVSIDRQIVTGKQTQIAYNDTIDFGTIKDIERIKYAVRQHPYSFYYLYDLERRVSEFSNTSFLSIFNCFDEKVKESETGKKLLSYVNTRQEKRLNFSTTSIDEEGQPQLILNKAIPYNLVILWASWCGPCRQEIPDLKRLYNRLGTSQKLRLVSVSLDKDKVAWHKAVKEEQMPWQQFLLSDSDQSYAKELFQFDGSIPTMLLFDNQGKVVKKMVGYEKNNLKLIQALVE